MSTINNNKWVVKMNGQKLIRISDIVNGIQTALLAASMAQTGCSDIRSLETELHQHDFSPRIMATGTENLPWTAAEEELSKHIGEFTILQRKYDPSISDYVDGKPNETKLYQPVASTTSNPLGADRHKISSRNQQYSETMREYAVFSTQVAAMRYKTKIEVALGGPDKIRLEVIPISAETINRYSGK